MDEIKIFEAENKLNDQSKREIVDFLHDHLEQYGDSKKDIQKRLTTQSKKLPLLEVSLCF